MTDEIDLLSAFFLGLIQGLSEFLPISSTAHLRLFSQLSGQKDIGAAYSAVIQLGSWLALLIYFRKDLYDMLAKQLSFLNKKSINNDKSNILIYLVIATIPICIAGLLLKDWIHGPLRNLDTIAMSLICVALWMGFADKLSQQKKDITAINWKYALVIGLAQALALIPGASRSGTTLAMALCLNFHRSAALRFSFLLSIPAIGLAGFYELINEFSDLKESGFLSLALGTLTAAISSYFCISFMLFFVRRYSILIFVFYRIALGIFIILFLA